MSSKTYIQNIVNELGNIINDTWTGKKNFAAVEKDYQRLRRRLYSFESLIGKPPAFLDKSDNLNALWHNEIKDILGSYDARRDFLKLNYYDHYSSLLENYKPAPFETQMAIRNLVIDRQIGAGGFGIVYLVEHSFLSHKRVVKKLDPIETPDLNSEKLLRRFAREADLLAGLSHNNIVRFYDAGMAGDHPFIIMEFVEGYNLDQYIRNNGNMDFDEATDLMLQITSAIGEAHKNNIVHRDLKPSNIMWDGKRAVVLDFGAGHWMEHHLSTRMTSSIVGTQGYIAPELFDNPQLVSPAIDTYSLGVIFHFALTGRLPATGDVNYYLKQHGTPEKAQSLIANAISPIEIRMPDANEFNNDVRVVRL